MSKEQNEQALRTKVADIRRRLMAGPGSDQLATLQLEIQVLEQWARLSRTPSIVSEDIDHMDDHDHTMPTGLSEVAVLAGLGVVAQRR